MLNQESRTYNRKFMLGCGLISLLLFGSVVALLSFTVSELRQDGYYENGRLLSDHSIYHTLPRSFRWDDSFSTLDTVRDAYGHYSLKYDMGAEQQAIGACIYSESSQSQGRFNLTVSVFICQGQPETLIYVTRTFYLR